MASWNKMVAVCIGLALFCGLCVTAYLVYTAPMQREISANLADLAIGVEAFPSGWEVKWGSDWVSIPERGLSDFGLPREAGYRVFMFSNNKHDLLAFHWLFRYQNQWQASEAFFLDYPKAFTRKENVNTLQEWDYRNWMADRVRFGCTNIAETSGVKQTRCTIMAQYDEIITIFDAPLLSNAMEIGDIERIFMAIDEQISYKLGRLQK